MTIAARDLPAGTRPGPAGQTAVKGGGRRARSLPALRLSGDLSLPIDYVTKAAAIVAQRRKGKTYTASVVAEELYAAQLPFVALDPTGAWWGLRASADGKSPGLPVVVIGGQHGDLPLERAAGAFVADLVLDHPGWYVLDLSLLDSRSAEREFATAFAERLYRRKMQPGMDFPLHLFVDEADMFVPQEKEGSGDVRMLGAFQAIVRRGGLHGLGSTLISQRPALINKSVLTQLDLLVILRLVAGNDQDAVDKNYVSRSSTKEQRAELMGSLASLPVGVAWFFEPGAEPDPIFARVQVRERYTFNSSATPKPGERRVEPRVLADVDLDALRDGMAETIERRRRDDPTELRKMLQEAEARVRNQAASIDDLTARLDEAAAAPPKVQVVGLRDDLIKALAALRHFDEGAGRVATAYEAMVEVTGPIREKLDLLLAKPEAPPAGRGERDERDTAVVAPPRLGRVGTSADATPPPGVAEAPRRADGVTGPQQKILDGLAWWGAVGVHAPTRGQLAFATGYAHSQSRGFRDPLYGLNAAELIFYPEAKRVSLTAEGLRLAQPPPATPTEYDFQETIYRLVGANRAKMLRVLIARHPDSISRDDLAVELGYSHAQSRGFRDPLYRLHSLELAEYPEPGQVRATAVCFL